MTQQEAVREFFKKLGRAFREWHLVEMQLFRVYARLVRCEEGAVAAAEFHGITGFSAVTTTEVPCFAAFGPSSLYSDFLLHLRAASRSASAPPPAS